MHFALCVHSPDSIVRSNDLIDTPLYRHLTSLVPVCSNAYFPGDIACCPTSNGGRLMHVLPGSTRDFACGRDWIRLPRWRHKIREFDLDPIAVASVIPARKRCPCSLQPLLPCFRLPRPSRSGVLCRRPLACRSRGRSQLVLGLIGIFDLVPYHPRRRLLVDHEACHKSARQCTIAFLVAWHFSILTEVEDRSDPSSCLV